VRRRYEGFAEVLASGDSKYLFVFKIRYSRIDID